MAEATRRTLSEIADEMESLASSDDTEAAHARADELLIEALCLSWPRPHPGSYLGRLLDAFRRLDKWYA